MLPISRYLPSIYSSILVSILAFWKYKLVLYPELSPTFSVNFSYDTINGLPKNRDPSVTLVVP